MSALTSLLARDHAVPVRKIEEALSKQVVSGGDIATVLLETDAIPENTLAAYQGALYGLLPATREEVMRVPRDHIRLVPREVAEKHRLVPLAVDGRGLLVAMAAPLDHDVESQLGFLLGYELVVRIVCEVRISAALAHHYGVDPPSRQKRLIEQLRHRDAGTVPYVAPPEQGKLTLSHRGSISKKVSASAWLDEPDEPEPPPPPPPPRPSTLPPPTEGRTTDPMGVPRSEVDAKTLEDEAPPVLAAHASLSDLAVSEGWSRPAPPRAPDTAAPHAPSDAALGALVATGVDGRSTSPYGRAPMRPPTQERAMPSAGALADASSVAARSSLGWQAAGGSSGALEVPRMPEPTPALDASAGPGEPIARGAPEPANATSRTDPSVPAARTGERLSVAPIVGVGVRRTSRPPSGAIETAGGDRARPIVEPVLDARASELPPPPRMPRERASVEARPPIATPASELPAALPPASTSALDARGERKGPKLRGPLTAAQAAKLLEDASDRDGIVAVFFAFARQFFDYAALFALQDDRAEGREAFGDGTSSARIRAISLTLAGDEVSLLGTARKSGAPQLGRLETPADVDLAAVLGRPREIFAIAYPVVIRSRAVLLLYGDRGGDPLELSELPELVGFVRRVADALEKLILRRKREGVRGRFEKPRAEDREDLKSSVVALRRSTRPPPPAPGVRPAGRPGREDVWSTPKLGAVVAQRHDTPGDRALVDALAKAELPSAPTSDPGSGVTASPLAADDLASRALDPSLDTPSERVTLIDPPPALEPPPPAEEVFRPTAQLARSAPEASPAIPDATPSPRIARHRQTMRDVLGIPRAAPPPPSVRDIFEAPLEPDPANEVMLGATAALSDEVQGPTTIPVPPPDASDDSPELVVASADDESSDPELEIGEADEGEGDDDEPAPIELRRRVGPSYLIKDAAVDVVERASGRASQPPATKRSVAPVAHEQTVGPTARRHDPRREDDGDPAVDVIQSQRGIGAMAKSAVIEAKGIDGARPTHDREVPSVIVDMGEATHTLVEDLMHADPEGDAPAIDALLKLGEAALPALAQAFPGPLWFDRRRPHRKLPRGRDVSAVARALVAFRERAAPYVGALAGAGAPDRRFYAVLVAGEIPSGALVDPLVQRVFDEDAEIRGLVLEVLPKFRAFAEMQDQLVFLRRSARIRGKQPIRRLYALAALSALRDAGGVRTLVDLLEDEDANVRRAAHAALVAITCEDLGETSRRWAVWVEAHESRHRIEWLVDALVSSDEALRTQAGEELKAITQQYFGFHPTASRKEREVVQTKYRNWWEREGRALFK